MNSQPQSKSLPPPQDPPPIRYAGWKSTDALWVSFVADWFGSLPPPIELDVALDPGGVWTWAPVWDFIGRTGYGVMDGVLHFGLADAILMRMGFSGKEDFLLAGDFNGWNPGADPKWRMQRLDIADFHGFVLRWDEAVFGPKIAADFKFMCADGRWVDCPDEAPNRVAGAMGPCNLRVQLNRAGSCLLLLTLPHGAPRPRRVRLSGSDIWMQVDPGLGLLGRGSDRPLGVELLADHTCFRVFAPRAATVDLHLSERPDDAAPQVIPMQMAGDGVWEAFIPGRVVGWFYSYSTTFAPDEIGVVSDPAFRILDPYALAAVGPSGPGIVIDREAVLAAPKVPLAIPEWQDLVIQEVHVRDLVRYAPYGEHGFHGKGFSDLAGWLNDPACSVRRIGVNAIELQPVQEVGDHYDKRPYHWGYMPVNWFAPESTYSRKPEKASGIAELQVLVAECHRQGLAVILDVVYNHVGEPNHLAHLDEAYYFSIAPDGTLMNWSGCGNTYRTGTPMGNRLMIDSLKWLVEAYDVDGFRFDLAELIEVSALRRVEEELKRIKPGLVLIAEPWSFRGNSAGLLKGTGFALWNDHYREYMARYLTGVSDASGVAAFLGGSANWYAAWPAQTVNYTESHDDMTWIDKITTNHGHDGGSPSRKDEIRTRMMFAMLLSSVGIPMLAQGQEWMRSKRGRNNTYRDGDVNALRPCEAFSRSGLAAYVGALVRLRLSDLGLAWRLFHRMGDGYMRNWTSGQAACVLWNADASCPHAPVAIFAMNPSETEVVFDTGLAMLDDSALRLVADLWRVDPSGLDFPCRLWWDGELTLPGESLGLWVAGAGSKDIDRIRSGLACACWTPATQ